MRSLPWLVLVACAGFAAARGAPAEESNVPLAVIVHGDVGVDAISLSDLRKVFLGDRQFWEGDTRIILLVPPSGSGERATLLARVYEKTETQYRHYWIAKVFREEAQSAPQKVSSPRLTGELVRQIPGAISVVDAAKVPPGVKVLRIDGKTAAEAGYPLR